MEDKTILKQLAEQKLKAFAVGNMGKRALTKKEQEEMRKKEEDKAAAHAFQEFVNTFQETPVNSTKIWVKAGTYDAGARREDTKEKGKLYKPQSRLTGVENLTSAERAQEYARLLAGDIKPYRLGKKKEKDKKKSNLELFKEELKQIQEEREERHKYKGLVKVPLEPDVEMAVKPEMGSFDNGDPNTTNLYLGNLNPKITEAQLMELFGKFGPLASIKIMWPRSEEEKARGRNCGFVAFMNRKDGERALRNLNGKDVMGYEMKLGWGKCVPIPPHPIYIPPALQELSMPPPASGLPFNAQPIDPDMLRDLDKNDSTLFDKILSQSVVKVTIPTDRNMLCLIHRTIEFVIREGPMFEAVIMNREINNAMFRFLFDNQSPQHIYYRWKLFSMMEGDTAKEWRTEDFRMFEGGSIWRPPPMNIYTQGMPDSLIVDEELKEPTKGALSVAQRDRLEELLRNLIPDRMKIAEAMVFAMEHSEAADEICNCILESLSNITTTIHKKIARLYLISDILHNSTAKINNASYYRRALEIRLVEIFRHAHATYENEDTQRAEGFKFRVMKILEAWREWAVYPRELIQRLENVFLGLDTSLTQEDIDEGYRQAQRSEEESDDGVPLEDETDGDAVPFDGAALLKGAIKHGHSNVENPSKFSSGGDTDGSPREDPDGMPLTPPPPKMTDEERRATGAMFVPSRWETVDPEQVEAQAMTTSKWDQLEASSHDDDANDTDSSDGPSNSTLKNSVDMNDLRMSEDRRRKLREVEVKAVQYQDELEAGHRTLKSGWSVAQQVEHYRRKLLRKMDKKFSAEAKEKLKDNSPQSERTKRHSADVSSSRSEHSKRSRSNTPDISYSGTSRKHKKKSRSSSHSVSPANDRSVSPTSPVERKARSRRSRSKTKEDLTPLSAPSPPRIKRSPKSAKRSRLDSPVSNHHSRRSTSPTHSSSTRYRNSLSPLNTSNSSPRAQSRRSRHDSPLTPPKSNRNNGGGRQSNHRRRDSVSPPAGGGGHKSKHSVRTLTPSPPRRNRRARTPSPLVDSNVNSSSGGHAPSKRHKHRY